MSLFQCENCGCCENTALCPHSDMIPEVYDWSGIEELKDKKLCSACGPAKYKDGTETEYGVWHGEFNRVFLPKGKFKTNKVGNLEHVDTGSDDFRQYEIKD